MKIAVNTRLLLKDKLEGIGWFAFETLKRITKEHPEHEFIFIFDRPFSPEFIFSDNITPVVTGPPARHPFLFYLWFELAVPHMLRKHKADIFLSPDGYLSLSAEIPSLPVMHDLSFLHYPKDVPWMMSRYYNYFFPRFAKKAARIATVSEFSKQDIIKSYKISPDKIDVVYNGAGEYFKPLTRQEQQQVRDQYTQGKPYFIFVSSLHPRKNLVNLLKAFDEFKKSSPSDVKLLVVGSRYYWTSEMETTIKNMEFKEEVIFTGRMPRRELAKALASALALTYVSYFEGFGIPIIEAFNTETPVIASNVTSLPEVAGDAALLVDPFSVESIKNGLTTIHKDVNKRAAIVEKGKEKRNNFTWNQTSEKLWSSIEKLAEAKTISH